MVWHCMQKEFADWPNTRDTLKYTGYGRNAQRRSGVTSFHPEPCPACASFVEPPRLGGVVGYPGCREVTVFECISSYQGVSVNSNTGHPDTRRYRSDT